MAAKREIEIEATPEEVWEALSTDEGRERWLDEPEHEIHVESADPPHRLVWWWSRSDEEVTRVEFDVIAAPAGTRVVVTETVPSVPLASLSMSFALVAA